MKLVGYLRVSTDDKGQDPDRQKAVILAAAAKENHEVVAWAVDEGISGTVPPLQRQGVLEALDLAERHEADGLIVESVDRWTRGGWQDFGVSLFLLDTDYDGMELIVADLPTQDKFLWELLGGIMASVAKMHNVRLRAQIKSGLANAKAKGWPNGQPGRLRKPDLAQEEYLQVVEWKKEGKGMRTCADLISKARCGSVVDRAVQRERCVSETWLRAEMVRLALQGADRQYRPVQTVQVETAGGKA